FKDAQLASEPQSTSSTRESALDSSFVAPEDEVDESDVFARLRALSLLKTSDEQSREGVSHPTMSVEPAVTDTEDEIRPDPVQVQVAEVESAPAEPRSDSDEEESVEDYMARLLSRMRSGSQEIVEHSKTAPSIPDAKA